MHNNTKFIYVCTCYLLGISFSHISQTLLGINIALLFGMCGAMSVLTLLWSLNKVNSCVRCSRLVFLWCFLQVYKCLN